MNKPPKKLEMNLHRGMERPRKPSPLVLIAGRKLKELFEEEIIPMANPKDSKISRIIG